MASKTTIVVTHDKETTADLKHKYQHGAGFARKQLEKLLLLFQRLSGGGAMGSLAITIDDGDGVQASGTITFSGVGQANDTILINGVTFTAKASGATGNEWNVGASAAASATALKNAINASATALVNKHVIASDNGAGVVTITSVAAVWQGALGNAVTIAEGVDGLSHMAVSGARLTGGTNSANSTSQTHSFGV